MSCASERLRQQVAGELLDQEAVVGHVIVERLDHPVAPEPGMAAAVDREAVGIGVPRGVEPVEGQALAEMRALEEVLDQVLVRLRVAAGDERLHLLGGRRQAQEVERQAADQRGPVGLGRRLQARGFQLREHEAVDGIADPALASDLRRHGPHGRDECPVGLVLRPLGDPLLEHRPSDRP